MTRYSYPVPDDHVPALGVTPYGNPDTKKLATALSLLQEFIDKKLITPLRSVIDGKSNNVGDVTLTASATTTTLTDPLIGPESFIDFMPQTANAVAAKANLYVSSRGNGTATLTHASSANADQAFSYLVVG